MRQTTKAEMRLEHGKAAASSPKSRATGRFGCPMGGYDRILLRGAPPRRNMAPDSPGIWGVSDYGRRGRMKQNPTVRRRSVHHLSVICRNVHQLGCERHDQRGSEPLRGEVNLRLA